MKPSFIALRQHYPRNTLQEALFADIGWTDLVSKPAYRDTWAIRMSVALLASGMSLPKARMKATAGKLEGRYIEPGQGKLSLILKRTWEKPEVYKRKAFRTRRHRKAQGSCFILPHPRWRPSGRWSHRLDFARH
jgi:hypothetical protein